MEFRKKTFLFYSEKSTFGCKLKDCNIWPYNEKKQYIEFIVGVDDNGRELHYTCDPSKLSNYFGANPDAPHYLTPIFFDSAVLSKYYSNPENIKLMMELYDVVRYGHCILITKIRVMFRLILVIWVGTCQVNKSSIIGEDLIRLLMQN